jgi:hypothetical protein
MLLVPTFKLLKLLLKRPVYNVCVDVCVCMYMYVCMYIYVCVYVGYTYMYHFVDTIIVIYTEKINLV